MNSFQLGNKSRNRDRFDAVFGTLFQPFKKFLRRPAAIRGCGEEQIIFRMLERQGALDHVFDGHPGHFVDAWPPGRSRARKYGRRRI